MHIGIDGNLLCGKKTGMGIVVFNVLKYWKATDDYKITVFIPEKIEEEYSKLIKKNGINIIKLQKCNYFKWEQMVLPKAIKENKVDILWCPYNTAPLWVKSLILVTVHDVIYMSLSLKNVPSIYKKAGVIYRRIIVPQAVKKAKKVITITKSSKDELIHCFPKANEKIQIVYNGIDRECNRLSEEEEIIFFKTYHIHKPYILAFGSLEDRKNTLGVIKAYERLPKNIYEKYQLVLFGFRGFAGSKEEKYIRNKNLRNIVVLGYITEKEKYSLYFRSKMFVFPSFSEGFGIPVLEAFKNNTPVITSNITSLPEVAGEAAILVSPYIIKEITEAMKSIIMNQQYADELIRKGIKQAEKYDWENTAERIWEIIKKV